MECPDDTAFAAYLDGSLAPAAIAGFEHHLDACDACRELFAAMGRALGPAEAPRAPRLRPRGWACGRYLVLDVRGAGGMGVVYTAYDPELDRKVALKLVRPQVTRRGVDLRERLVREARALARISHPNVVPVYDVGETDGEVFIAMELVPGPTLARWQAAAARPWAAILEMYLQAARGLARAHEAGVVHRDFKPSNAIVGPDGRVRVVDFGLALAGSRDEADEPGEGTTSAAASSSLTATGALVGTPAYMAPEQREGAVVDARSDQYSLCAALWEALTGTRHDANGGGPSDPATSPARPARPAGPRASDDARAHASRQAGRARGDDDASRGPDGHGSTRGPSAIATRPADARPAARRGCPRWLRQLVQRGLSPDPQARFPDMPALIEACERRLRRGRYGLALAGSLAAVVAAVALARPAAAPRLCADDPGLLAGVWDPAAAEELRAAFTASGLPYAPTIAATAVADLDAWAARWQAEHRAACEATRVYGHQTEATLADRTTCLGEQRTALRERVALLRRGDRDVVEAALAIVHDLPAPARCGDPRGSSLAADELGEAAADRAAVDRAAALVEAGRFAAAEAELAPAAERARVRGWHPLVAAAQHTRAEARRRGGQAAEAEHAYYAALWAAEAARDDRTAARAWHGLTWLLADDLARPAEATRAAGHARAAVARSGDDPLLAAEVEVSAAIAERASGDFRASNTRLHAAVAALEQHTDAGDPRLLAALRLYGRSFYDLGAFDDAVAQYRRALTLAERSLGAEHPAVADLANNLGTTLIDLGDTDAAEAELRRALAIADRVYGPRHLSTAATRTNLANLAQARRDLPRAEQLYRDALAIYAAQPQEHPDAGKVAYNYGMVLINLGRPAEALAQFEGAHALLRRTLGDDHPDAGAYLTGIGVSLAALGRHTDAIAPLEQACETFERRPRDARFLASARFELAQALWTSGRDRARALALSELAAEVYRRNPESARMLAEVVTWLDAHATSRPAR
ncbi:MAG: tetratricopeptide repeat protein [Myxococcales bacterium]|nr:tetratricopeptide repeat protein [Myxococcales bacterium]